MVALTCAVAPSGAATVTVSLALLVRRRRASRFAPALVRRIRTVAGPAATPEARPRATVRPRSLSTAPISDPACTTVTRIGSPRRSLATRARLGASAATLPGVAGAGPPPTVPPPVLPPPPPPRGAAPPNTRPFREGPRPAPP